ncbi:hypothetical protein K2Z84_15275 [Candidatus Binatia bacterium]|nr:hypothetical protein [Candidatus Binatia bacterium]
MAGSRTSVCLTIVLVLALGAGRASAQECTVADGEATAQTLLDDVISPFDAAWPTIAKATGLDPFDNVYDGSVDLGCGLGDLGYTVCGIEGSSCVKMWADVDVSQITGLEDLSLTSLTVTSTTATDGTSCPYSSKSVDDTSFGCSYSGEGTGTGALTGTLTADVSSIEIRVECDFLDGLDKYKDTLWSGHATATATGGTATADLKYCAGLCNVDSGVASLVYLGMDDLKLDLHDVSVNIVTDGADVDIDAALADEIGDIIADSLKSSIEAALSPVITEALDDEVDEILPLPESCSSASSTTAAAASARPSSGGTQPAAQASSAPPAGALVCYDAGLVAGSGFFTPLLDVTLADARERSDVSILRQAQVCNPASGGAWSPALLQQPFVGYVLQPVFGAPSVQLPDAALHNAFGAQRARFDGALPDLMLSSARSVEQGLDVGCIVEPGAYRCSAAFATEGGLDDEVLRIVDPFDDRELRLGSLRSVCAPLRVDGTRAAAGWLACYTTLPVLGPIGFASPSSVDVLSGFGTQTIAPLDADRRLCVPTEVVFDAPAPTPLPARLPLTAGGGSGSSSLGAIPSGGSCARLRPHLDPGLGIYARSVVTGIVR